MPFSHSEQYATKAIQELYTKSEHIDCAYDTINKIKITNLYINAI